MTIAERSKAEQLRVVYDLYWCVNDLKNKSFIINYFFQA
jgi:hypothetical protein